MSVLSGGLLVQDAKNVDSAKITIAGYLVLKSAKKTSTSAVVISYKPFFALEVNALFMGFQWVICVLYSVVEKKMDITWPWISLWKAVKYAFDILWPSFKDKATKNKMHRQKIVTWLMSVQECACKENYLMFYDSHVDDDLNKTFIN